MATGTANSAAYAAILKEAYDDSNGVNEQINNETEVLNLMKKSTMEWQGKKLIVPAHVGRNSGVENIAEGGKLPDPGHQEDVDFIITNKIMAGRGTVSRTLMKAAPSKGAGAFLSYMDGEIDRLKDDIVDQCDLRAVSGGLVKGYVNEHKADNATGGAFVPGGASNAGADVTWEYAGEFDPFRAIVAANTNSWVRVRLFRQDTLAEILPTGGAAVTRAIFVKGFDEEAGTIVMVGVADAAGSSFTTAAVGTGHAISIELHPTQLTDGAGNKFGTVVSVALQQSGIFTNLSTASHWTVDRTTATGFPVLQSKVLTQAVAGAHARATISVKRMQALLDRIHLASKSNPELVLMHPLQRQSYVGILTATTQWQTRGKGETGDASPTEITFAGKPIRTARHVPRGMVIFLTGKTWELCEYAKGSFIDEDGNILSRVADHDAMEFAYTWEYNTFCRRPNANGILVGVTLE